VFDFFFVSFFSVVADLCAVLGFVSFILRVVIFVCSRAQTQAVLGDLGVVLCCSSSVRLVCLSILFFCLSLFERREML
jgi:hypothetical protein